MFRTGAFAPPFSLMTPSAFFWVAIGGATGSCLRFATGQLMLKAWGPGFPWGTLTVNLLGSLLAGLLATFTARLGVIHKDLFPALMTGILGGFTTYSAFNTESVKMLSGPEPFKGMAYLAATLAGCLLMGFAGVLAGKTLGGGL